MGVCAGVERVRKRGVWRAEHVGDLLSVSRMGVPVSSRPDTPIGVHPAGWPHQHMAKRGLGGWEVVRKRGPSPPRTPLPSLSSAPPPYHHSRARTLPEEILVRVRTKRYFDCGKPSITQKGSRIPIDVAIIGGHEDGLSLAVGSDAGGLCQQA